MSVLALINVSELEMDPDRISHPIPYFPPFACETKTLYLQFILDYHQSFDENFGNNLDEIKLHLCRQGPIMGKIMIP